MGAMDPRLPDYDAQTYREARWPEKIRMACQDWVVNGFGNPFPVYFFYPFKLVVLWLLPWMFFCSLSADVDSTWALSSYAFTATAFQKAILWNLFFEVFGLGCASGPLSGHYNPPFGGAPHFLRPGTIKQPLFEKLPLLGGHKRTVFDVALYVALLAVLLRGLFASQIDPLSHVLPAVIILFAFGLLDKTIFLAARAEHYLTAAVCLLSTDWHQGLMWVWAAVWFWAGVSKLTRHFPAVVASMHATSPLTYSLPSVKRAMYRDHPDDLNPSLLAKVIAHLGAINELAIPFLLIFSPSPEVTLVGLALMVWLHLFVTSNVPLGVPIEWNAMMVYGGFFLFYGTPSSFAFTLSDPFLIAYLVVAIGLVQLVGNIAPKYVSFLVSMRYYAGNWAYSTWLFRGDSVEKLDEHIKKSALTTRAQLEEMDMYDEDTITLMMSKLPVFRFMHYQGRMMHTLVPKAVGGLEHVDEYEQYDGENIATLVLGWAFGDGHLHREQLLRAIQAECNFEAGELRCVFVESQPLFKQACAWRIVDAKEGEIARGEMRVSEMLKRQPWPEVRGEAG